VRVDGLEHWLSLEGYVRRPRTGQTALDCGTAATLTCQSCGREGVDLLALEHPDGHYRALAWCPARRCRQAVEI
jgi:hypothetical protein